MSVALVTGSSSGIGLATALHFARLGHEVYAGIRNPTTAVELIEAIDAEKLRIRPVLVDVVDVDDAGSVTRAVSEVLGQSGRIDVLVNNAGIGAAGPSGTCPLIGRRPSSRRITSGPSG